MSVKFEYDPEMQTIYKFKDGAAVGSISVSDTEVHSLSFLLWSYLVDKKFSIEVDSKK